MPTGTEDWWLKPHLFDNLRLRDADAKDGDDLATAPETDSSQFPDVDDAVAAGAGEQT